MPAGRPTKYKPEMCEQVIACGKKGMGKAEMAVKIKVHHSTFNAWREEKPEFSAAVNEAVRQSQAWWERKGRKATFGKIDGYNATSYIFNMKNRFREDWADRKQLEHTGKDGGPIETSDVSPHDKLAEFLDAKSNGPTGDPTAE